MNDERNQLRVLQSRINYAHNRARAIAQRALAERDQAKLVALAREARAWNDRADQAQKERDDIKAKRFGSAHPRFANEPLQRKKAATAARMAQRRKDHGYDD